MITPGSVHYSLININCRSKVILLLKLQILLDPDRIPLTYVSVTYTDYRSAFSPTKNVSWVNLTRDMKELYHSTCNSFTNVMVGEHCISPVKLGMGQ